MVINRIKILILFIVSQFTPFLKDANIIYITYATCNKCVTNV